MRSDTKLVVYQGSAASSIVPSQITARLEALPDFDTIVGTVGRASDNPFRSYATPLILNVVHDFPAGGDAVVKLDKKPDETPHLEWAWLKITAFQVDESHNGPMP